MIDDDDDFITVKTKWDVKPAASLETLMTYITYCAART